MGKKPNPPKRFAAKPGRPVRPSGMTGSGQWVFHPDDFAAMVKAGIIDQKGNWLVDPLADPSNIVARIYE